MNSREIELTEAAKAVDAAGHELSSVGKRLLERPRGEAWKDHIVIAYEDKYEEHGCDFSGSLAVVDCNAAWEHHPKHGGAGAMSSCDVTQEAKRVILERHPGAAMLLGFPATVMRIDEAEWIARNGTE